MQEKDLGLLFETGALSKCIITADASGKGFNAMFVIKGDKTPSEMLDTRPRKSGDSTEIRVFKTIDSATSLVKRQIGFGLFTLDIR